jgi:hypothetical protein
MTESTPEGRRRDVYVPVWLSQLGANTLDEKRGTWSRSEYIRQALNKAVTSGLQGPKPKGPF